MPARRLFAALALTLALPAAASAAGGLPLRSVARVPLSGPQLWIMRPS